MRTIIFTIALIGLGSTLAFAQFSGLDASEAQPQIAYHLFSNWADNYEVEAKRGKAVATGLLYGTGALSLGGAALTWYGGDELSRQTSGSDMDYSLKKNMTIGLGITGGVLLLSGMIVSSIPIKDYRAIYADVFEEPDPEVREAMAVSVLRYQADQGKERRITSFISGFVVPILAGGITAGFNLAEGEKWDKDVLSSMANSSWWMAGSIVSLFQKTPEERLYERYLSTRDALYGSKR
jgi:hypothetical protein